MHEEMCVPVCSQKRVCSDLQLPRWPRLYGGYAWKEVARLTYYGRAIPDRQECSWWTTPLLIYMPEYVGPVERYKKKYLSPSQTPAPWARGHLWIDRAEDTATPSTSLMAIASCASHVVTYFLSLTPRLVPVPCSLPFLLTIQLVVI